MQGKFKSPPQCQKTGGIDKDESKKGNKSIGTVESRVKNKKNRKKERLKEKEDGDLETHSPGGGENRRKSNPHLGGLLRIKALKPTERRGV